MKKLLLTTTFLICSQNAMSDERPLSGFTKEQNCFISMEQPVSDNPDQIQVTPSNTYNLLPDGFVNQANDYLFPLGLFQRQDDQSSRVEIYLEFSSPIPSSSNTRKALQQINTILNTEENYGSCSFILLVGGIEFREGLHIIKYDDLLVYDKDEGEINYLKNQICIYPSKSSCCNIQ